MGRSPLVVKKEELQAEINRLESLQTFATQQDLFKAVEASEWGKAVKNANWRTKGIKAPVVYAKVREFSISMKTLPGKRGRAKGAVVNRTSRASKMDTPDIKKATQKLRDDINNIAENKDRLLGMVDKIEEGSINAAIKLKCMECRGYEGTDYKQCTATCPLLPVNLMFWPRK